MKAMKALPLWDTYDWIRHCKAKSDKQAWLWGWLRWQDHREPCKCGCEARWHQTDSGDYLAGCNYGNKGMTAKQCRCKQYTPAYTLDSFLERKK